MDKRIEVVRGSTLRDGIKLLGEMGLLMPVIEMLGGGLGYLITRFLHRNDPPAADYAAQYAKARRARVVLGALLYIVAIFLTVFLVKLAWRLC